MRSSHKLFPSGATHGLPSDKLWVRNISMPTIVSICSSVVNRSINSWTGTLPLGSRKYSIRHSTTATVQDISCYLKLKITRVLIRRRSSTRKSCLRLPLLLHGEGLNTLSCHECSNSHRRSAVSRLRNSFCGRIGPVSFTESILDFQFCRAGIRWQA
jgi:hypothetical protein